MNNIVVIGSSNTDMVIQTSKLPLPGETILGGKFFTNPGGKGANQAVAVARMGAMCTFITKLGNDFFGDQAKKGFISEGIDIKGVLQNPTIPSGVALITIDAKGENSIVVAPGANDTLLPHDILSLEKLIDSSDMVITQLEIPLHTVAFIKEFTFTKNKKLILNPAPAKELPDSIYKNLFLITPNESEASALSGVFIESNGDIKKIEESAGKAAKVLFDKGVQNVIITLGKNGAFLKTASIEKIIPGILVDAIDTTAAGDTFNGALAVAICEGMDWEAAIHFANKAASISVTRIGAQSSVPYRKEII